eukprot:TRINITY_DN70_c0_g1_i1.p1 TRINITY_DN70_c0_g1~~TRINITY_DN70_c0_g1_i1.p1  ORF type:complete len:420 (-),score=85.17 TRINITY_DN70_c0_g1_i1:1597-2856(-)
MKPVLYVVESRKNASPKVLPIDTDKADDQFYRYKMRQLLVQVVGKGKMIRTAMLNLDDVAHDLQVPPDYIPNYFGKTIGATAKYDRKKPARERGSISGEYDIPELSSTLLKFITCFVLCKKCKYPEYQYMPVKKNVRVKCKSCGYKTDVHRMDLDERFKRYVVNHPPPKPVPLKKKSSGKKGADKAVSKAVTKATANANPSKKSSIKKQDWSDVSEEAVKNRMDAMVPSNLQGLVDAGDEDDRVKYAAVLSKYAANHSAEEIIAELSRMKELYGMSDVLLGSVVCGGLFSSSPTLFYDNLQKYSAVLQKHVTSENGQVEFLRNFEAALAAMKTPPKKFFTAAPGVFQYATDEDILDDESFLVWFESESLCAPLRKAVGPFIDWLKDAEEGSSEEDSADKSEEEKEPEKTVTIEDELDAL